MPGHSDQSKLQEELLSCGRKFPSFNYPWAGIEDALRSLGLTALPLIGYGSLINRQSAGRTINVDSSAGRRPVQAYGARRIFNYRIPESALTNGYGPPEGVRMVAALNCEATYRTDEVFNGVLTHIAPDHLEALRIREQNYSLRPIICHDWASPGAVARPAYILELLPDEWVAGHPYDADILPHRGYTRVCQEGAAAISSRFLDFFNRTCWLADRTRTLHEYLRQPQTTP